MVAPSFYTPYTLYDDNGGGGGDFSLFLLTFSFTFVFPTKFLHPSPYLGFCFGETSTKMWFIRILYFVMFLFVALWSEDVSPTLTHLEYDKDFHMGCSFVSFCKHF